MSRVVRHAWAAIATCVFITLLWLLAVFLWFLTEVNATDSIAYVVAANFGIMAWASILFGIYKPSLSSRWFDSFGCERDGRLYETFGVLEFGWFLQTIGWNRLLGVPSVRKNHAGISQLESGTRFSEASHWLCLVPILIILCVCVGPAGRWVSVAFWMGSAISFHLYPIMLQRYHRPRFRRVLEHMERTGADTNASPGLSVRASSQSHDCRNDLWDAEP